MKIIAVIPARLQSTRLPSKPLIKVLNKFIIQYVYEGVSQASHLVDKVIVATDSVDILNAVTHFGGEAILTAKTHRNGTDRIREVLKKYPDYDLTLNIQGDEPLVNVELIRALISPFEKDPHLNVATLCHPIYERKDLLNPNCVKVVLNQKQRALYFSRSPIPYRRNKDDKTQRLKHIGLYAFKTKFLQTLHQHKSMPLEKAEALEQLRILEMDESIAVTTVITPTIDINTSSDLKKFKRYLLTSNDIKKT